MNSGRENSTHKAVQPEIGVHALQKNSFILSNSKGKKKHQQQERSGQAETITIMEEKIPQEKAGQPHKKEVAADHGGDFSAKQQHGVVAQN